VSAKVNPHHAGEANGATSAWALGVVATLNAVKTTACTRNITNVIGTTRFATNSARSSMRICPIKNTEANNVSDSPRPNRIAPQSNCPSTATPASTSAQDNQTDAPGFRRVLHATQSGINIA
tara:strand:- start:8275 stop:8640 length:366 start_codon:yes stop_codon:yes gene_type:complete